MVYAGDLHILICAEDGEDRAKRTLNARLGILGGISILGTRGIVRPYSHEAWKSAIRQGMDVAHALGLEQLLLSTGRRSERLGFGLYPGLPPQAGIQVADFAAFALREATSKPFRHLVWLCFPGKLLKLAQGLEWTHAKEAPADMGMLADLCKDEDCPAHLLGELESMPTAAGVFALLQEKSETVHNAVLNRLGRKAHKIMGTWLEGARPGWHATNTLSLHVFSLTGELLFTL